MTPETPNLDGELEYIPIEIPTFKEQLRMLQQLSTLTLQEQLPVIDIQELDWDITPQT